MIQIDHVTKTFTGKELVVAAVNDVSLTIHDGEVYGIIGYSGAGKSTLVRCLNFLETPNSGSITVSGYGTITAENNVLFYTDEDGSGRRRAKEKDLQALRQKMGMIFQHFNLMDRSTIYDNIAYPLKYKGKSKQEIHDRVIELLELVDLKDKINSYPSELSGGQKQRVAIARALANNPQILLSDEATSALDPEATESILNLLRQLNEKLGLTIVLITHEMAVVKSICEKVAVMENGRVVEQGEVYDVFANPKQPITRNFVEKTSNLNVQKLIDVNSSMVQPDKDSVLIKCVYGRDCVGDALISEASRKFNVNISIVLANVEVLQGSPLGGMVVLVSGSRENTDACIQYMREMNVKVEVLKDGRVVAE